MILDEATSAMDVVTDQKMTSLVQSEFSSCTVLTIAHRLHTVIGGDRIILLQEGTILESGTPRQLLTDTKSQFYQMAQAAGLSQQH